MELARNKLGAAIFAKISKTLVEKEGVLYAFILNIRRVVVLNKKEVSSLRSKQFELAIACVYVLTKLEAGFLQMTGLLRLSLRLSHSEFLLSSDHSLNTVVHILGEVDFVAAKTAEVRDVKHSIVGLSVLSMSATDLDVVLVGDGLESVWVLSELGKLDVDGGAHASSTVSRARGDVTKMLVVGETSLLLNLSSSSGESLEDLTDV